MTITRTDPRPFDAILCDVDNVIRRYDAGPVAARERDAGVTPGATARVAFAPGTDLPALLGRITRREWMDAIARGLAAQVGEDTARELADAFATAPFHADEEVVALLRLARAAGMPLVLVSNATLELEEDLESLGLADLADAVVSSARVGVVKPDRAIYELAVGKAGVPAARCLFVDDRLENVEAAAALGMHTVHFREAADLRARLGFLTAGGE